MFGWVINPKRLVVTVALGLVLVAAFVLVGFVVVVGSRETCLSQNRALDALTSVVLAQAAGPHRFNEPADRDRRSALLTVELTQIQKARCTS